MTPPRPSAPPRGAPARDRRRRRARPVGFGAPGPRPLASLPPRSVRSNGRSPGSTGATAPGSRRRTRSSAPGSPRPRPGSPGRRRRPAARVTLGRRRPPAPGPCVATNITVTGGRQVTLDIGHRDGVEPNLTVVAADGLVGRVVTVGPWSTDIRLLDGADAAVAVRVGAGVLGSVAVGPRRPVPLPATSPCASSTARPWPPATRSRPSAVSAGALTSRASSSAPWSPSTPRRASSPPPRWCVRCRRRQPPRHRGGRPPRRPRDDRRKLWGRPRRDPAG